MKKEGKTDLIKRCVKLRAEGWSYADIAAMMPVSKPVLIAWDKELQKGNVEHPDASPGSDPGGTGQAGPDRS